MGKTDRIELKVSNETYEAVCEFVERFGKSGTVIRGNLKYYTNKGVSGVIKRENRYSREDLKNGESKYGVVLGYKKSYSLYTTENGSNEDFVTIFWIDNYIEDNSKLNKGYDTQDFKESIKQVKDYMLRNIKEYESKQKISNLEVRQALDDFENELKK